jgi:chromosome segregation ATPase
LADQVVQLRAALDETTQRSDTERDALGREKGWLEVRRTALETDLAEARSQLLAASAEVEQLSAQAAQLRVAIDDTSRQWAVERQALSQEISALEERRTALETDLAEARIVEAEARDDAQRQERQIIQLQAAVQALGEESGKAFAASAAAQLRAEKAESQATWADFHVAEFVEKEAVAASELARRRDEVAALVFGIKRLLSIDDLPGNDLPMAVARLREHFRTLERELDQAEAERDRLGAVLQERTTLQIRSAGRVRRYIRRLFQRADHHGNFIAMRG